MFLKNLYRLLVILFAVGSIGCNRTPDEGVSLELAKERKKYYHDIDYSINLKVPRQKTQPISGKINISFQLYENRSVIIDFREKVSNILSLTSKGRKIKYRFENGHIIIPSKYLSRGKNSVQVEFIAGETSLNRKEDFLYSLFVPDRASTAFPCFDQPNLKATFELSLEIPKPWVAVSNGHERIVSENDSTRFYQFGKTQPISTYLFAFVVGRFDSIGKVEGSRKIVMYHRENDKEKVKRNLDGIFKSHFYSLYWLKEYTEIGYPFGKLDFILIPDFQYSGMEHPGAIYYRDSRILLDENPSENQLLRQANLIAHEVAHQWFGDLVTMHWFNDVWMKEVFAGFMADKIVNPQYPKVNHKLNFLLSHYPRAYSVDRTMGANPIRQQLGNMLNAGTLYGDIIYHKAPIMMMQLEELMQPEQFRRGVIDYLKIYQMENAGWEELIANFKPFALFDVQNWSNAWVYQPTMPKINTQIDTDSNKIITDYRLIQTRYGNALPMAMKYSVLIKNQDHNEYLEIAQNKDTISVYDLIGKPFNSWILPNADGKGYGFFIPDSTSIKSMLDTSNHFTEPVSRASWYITLNELFLNGKVDKFDFYSLIIAGLKRETEPQIRQYLLDNFEQVWWKFMGESERNEKISSTEEFLFKLITSPELKDNERKPVFWTYTRILNSNEARHTLFGIWNESIKVKGIKLDEQDYMSLAYELAIRDYQNTDSILNIQEKRIKNPDRLAKFRFIRRAVSSSIDVRDSFFNGLSDATNRRPEPWVTEALVYLHHPLRAKTSVKYLKTSLDVIEIIQKTGDIFFPKAWLDATLGGYNSPEAAKIVIAWLQNNPQVPKNLRDKVYQSADILFRAAGKR